MKNQSFLRRLGYSLQGIRSAWKHEASTARASQPWRCWLC